MTKTQAVTVVPPGSSNRFWLISDLITPLVGPEKTGGAFEMVEAVSPINAGPPPHVHAREDEMFYVVAGEYQFIFEDTMMNAGPGSCVFLPRGKVHTFSKVGAKPGKMIVTVLPAGFGRAAHAASQPCTDPTTPPPMSPAAIEKMTAACAAHGIEFKPEWKPTRRAAPAKPSRELWVLEQHVKLLLTSKETGGQFTVMENTSLTGDPVPLHIHEHQDEMFYVLEGTYEFDTPGGKVNAGPGTFLHVPRGTPHGFRNSGRTPAKLVDFHTPGGFEQFFEGVGTICKDIKAGPPKGPVDFERMMRVARECGMELVG